MPGRNFTDIEEEQIGKIYLSGKSARAIAKAYGLSHHISICSALERQGIKQRNKSERNRLYKLNPHIFDSLDNEQSAYWHGFIYADGCLQRNKSLAIALSVKDKEHIDKFKMFAESESPIKINIDQSGGWVSAKIELTDKHLGKQLTRTGIVTGRLYPEKIFSAIPDNMFCHWFRGFFDGDGSARKSQTTVLCGDYKLLEILRGKLHDYCGTNPNLSISKHRTANLYYIYYSKTQSISMYNFMYKDATVWLERKRDVMDSWE